MDITAKEAREKAGEYNLNRYSNIMKRIETAAKAGKYEITILKEDYPNFEVGYFTNLGYSVLRWEDLITIMWRRL